jgi:hypothetical protein
MKYLRMLIREMLAEEEVLGEPDESAEDEREADEQSVVTSVAGATTPVGTSSTYPNKKKKKKT